MADPYREYNPLDYDNLTINLIRELMGRDPHPLPLPTTFTGAGVYALFYDGPFPPYAPVRSPDASRPIYVGKAVPAGARTGRIRGTTAGGQALYKRLAEHAESIQDAASTLALGDFRCRFLVVTPLWITMAERFLIEYYQPVWNVCLPGFGVHDPGKGRHQGEISWWDALHPGRPWAARLRQTRTATDAATHLAACMQGLLPRQGPPSGDAAAMVAAVSAQLPPANDEEGGEMASDSGET